MPKIEITNELYDELENLALGLFNPDECEEGEFGGIKVEITQPVLNRLDDWCDRLGGITYEEVIWRMIKRSKNEPEINS